MFITGVIGYPLKTSLSPLLHNNAFRSLGLEGRYFPLCVPVRDFERVIKSIMKLGFSGLNVTNPYKMEIFKYLDGFSPLVKKVNAVNTVIMNNWKLLGENTDVFGFDKSLKEHSINLRDKKILLIGAGGVARAIAYVINQKKPGLFLVSNRTKTKALSLAEKHKGNVIDLRDAYDIVKEVDIVINATSVDIQDKVIPHLKKGSIYYDTNYCFHLPHYGNSRVVNGITMLLYQAAYSFSLWTGEMPPIQIMKNTIKEVPFD